MKSDGRATSMCSRVQVKMGTQDLSALTCHLDLP